jgi:hypothetical protein
VTEKVIQVQKTFRTPNRKDRKRNTLRYRIVKTLNKPKKEY